MVVQSHQLLSSASFSTLQAFPPSRCLPGCTTHFQAQNFLHKAGDLESYLSLLFTPLDTGRANKNACRGQTDNGGREEDGGRKLGNGKDWQGGGVQGPSWVIGRV